MNTVAVSLPDGLESFVDGQVADGDFASGADYIRELVAKERDRQQLRRLLLEGAASPLGAVADEAYFAALRERARKRTAG